MLSNQKKKILVFSLLFFLIFIFYTLYIFTFNSHEFDMKVTLFLQRNIPKTLDLPFSILSVLGSFEITSLIFVLLTFFYLFKKNYLLVLSLLLFPAISVIELLGKLFIYHPGPPFNLFRGVLNLNLPSHYVSTSYSYPSGHVTRTTFLVVFFLFFIYSKKIKQKLTLYLFLGLFLALMFLSRVYLGEHWTSDVIGGLLLGSSFGLFSAITIQSTKS